MGRWVAGYFSKPMSEVKPIIEHIRDLGWGKDDIQLGPNMRDIRGRPRPRQIIGRIPDVETWLGKDYTEKDIANEVRRLENNKAHGIDCIPGAACKATREWGIKQIMHIANDIETG